MNAKRSKEDQIKLFKAIRDYKFVGIIPLSLWDHFRGMFNEKTAMYAFASQLAKKMNWKQKFAERVVNEYKKFCFLGMVFKHDVTPSKAVDEAWHLHMSFSAQYREFCEQVLGEWFDHTPGFGLKDEFDMYNTQYLETLEAYKSFFGKEAPADIWPHEVSLKKYEEKNNEPFSSQYYDNSDNIYTPLVVDWDASTHGSFSISGHFGGFGGGQSNGGGAGGTWSEHQTNETTTDTDTTDTDAGTDGDGASCGGSCGGGCGGD